MRLTKRYEDVELEIARCFVERQPTIRKTAKELKISKSTVHKKLRSFIDRPHVSDYEKDLAGKVSRIIEKNTQERHIRGGNKTKEKFLEIKQRGTVKK